MDLVALLEVVAKVMDLMARQEEEEEEEAARRKLEGFLALTSSGPRQSYGVMVWERLNLGWWPVMEWP